MKAVAMIAVAALVLTACGGGGGDSSVPSSVVVVLPPPVATGGGIEDSLGTILQRPVMQCGSGVDTLTADAAPGSMAVFESAPVRPLALSADGQRLFSLF